MPDAHLVKAFRLRSIPLLETIWRLARGELLCTLFGVTQWSVEASSLPLAALKARFMPIPIFQTVSRRGLLGKPGGKVA